MHVLLFSIEMPLVIPFFIPHSGCPHQCLFCNQHSITGKGIPADNLPRQIEETVVRWLSYRSEKTATHLAFYGGSFTCLPETVQRTMLGAVQPFIADGSVDTIRLSTRPDCISADICRFLHDQHVGIVELGVQSLDDKVLLKSRRGHTEQDCIAAAEHVQKAALQLGIQLMPGLPAESRYSFMETVRKTCALQPDFVRIYPALVVADSGLAQMYTEGMYTPLSLDMAIVLAAWARRIFLARGIRVVRMGLQPSTALEQALVAGPYHPAFGELVMSREWFRRIRQVLAANCGKKIRITVSSRDLSAIVGGRRKNMKRLDALGFHNSFEIVADKSIKRGIMHHAVC